MAMVSHNPGMAKKTGVPVKVAKEFNRADAGGGLLGRALKKRKPK